MYSNVRRTYKSKKETFGGLEPKDLLSNMDKKSSVFDAFYIQNIKQTKRELSCISASNHHGTASKKVRKRKFVKRVVKNAELSEQDLTTITTYLTPDKSLRVNKAFDPFDMLLNSSPVCPAVPESKDNPVITSNVKYKQYSRKKQTNKKKHYNCSSSTFTDSEKENCNELSKIQNTTDIKSHKLLIELDSMRPKAINESIDQIVENLSAFRKQSASPIFKTPIKFRRNRLTQNSPPLKTSPLCSTPFKEKYRGQSIYRFSPIVGRLSSPNINRNADKNHTNDTVVSVYANIENDIHTPLIEANGSAKCSMDKFHMNMELSNHQGKKVHNIAELGLKNVTVSPYKDVENSNGINLSTEIRDKTEKIETFESMKHNLTKECKNYDNDHESDVCSLGTSEMEPFLGFSELSDKDIKPGKAYKELVNHDEMNYCGNVSFIDGNNENSGQNSLIYGEKHTENENIVQDNTIKLNTSINHSIENVELACNNTRSSYNTCDSDSSDSIPIKNPIIFINKLGDSVTSQCSERTKNNMSCITDCKYDNNGSKVPVVLIEKLSDSVVFKYSEKNNDSDISNNRNECYDHNQKEPVVLLDKLSDSLVFELYDQMMSRVKSNDSTEEKDKLEEFSANNKTDIIINNTSKGFKEFDDSEGEHNNTNSIINKTAKSNLSQINLNYKSHGSDVTKYNLPEYNNTSYYSNASRSNSSKEFESFDESDASDCVQFEVLKSNEITSSCNTISENTCSDESNELSHYSDNKDDTNSENDIQTDDEGQAVSFVTTRRKNRANSSLFMSMYSNSVESNSLSISTECEKTVLSNKISLERDLENIIHRQSLNTNHEDQSVETTVKINSKKQTRRSSIKARNRKSRLSNANQQSHIKLQSQDSSDQTNDESEDNSNVTLYKIASSNILSKVNKTTKYADPNIYDKTSNDKIITKESSDSDVITITETDSDDVVTIHSKDILPEKKKTLILNSKSGIVERVESEENDSVPEIIGHINNSRKTGRYSQFTTPFNIRMSQKIMNDTNRNSKTFTKMDSEVKQGIVLQPGKKWERSLSIYRRMSMMGDFDVSVLDEGIERKGRKYRESVINTMEMQDSRGSLHNETINSQSSFVSKPKRSTIVIVKNPDSSRQSLSSSSVYEDMQGFLNDECDDTIIGLSKLSLADANHEVTVLGCHEKSERGSTARDYVLRRCNQTDTILFDECYPDTVLKNCHKIGEGVYGEVFLWRDRDGRARVMKIVPVAGTVKVNGENQKNFQEIISEIVIAMELSALRSPIAAIDRHFENGKDVDTLDIRDLENATDVFNEVLAVRCVYGNYPSRLLDLWDLYDECKGSDNDNPAILPDDQQYIVLELANAGQDLESYQFNNAEQAHALFLQVAFGLAVGEEAYQFEHRDLHWGNVLIAPTDQKYASFVLRGRCHRVPRCGVAATIIDYSLSRLSFPLGPAGDRAALYNDLSTDDGLFDAIGDYQFEVYRLMRDKLGNDWKNFEPYTNILWLHYTVDKMITALRYKRVNTKIHKHYIQKLKGIKNRLLSYGSAVQFVLTDNEF